MIHEPTYLVLSDGGFSFSTGQTTIKAYECFFSLDTALGECGRTPDNIVLVIDGVAQDTTTAIADIEGSTPDAPTFNLRGQRVTTPRRGLYIRNGQKVIKK